MVKIHLWKSEIALCISSIEERETRKKPDGVEEDLYKDTLKKLKSAYNSAER